MTTFVSQRLRAKQELTSLAGLTLCLFVVSIPWVKIEFFPRLAATEILFLLLVGLFYVQYTIGKKRLYKPVIPPSGFMLLLVTWSIAVLVSGLSVQFTSTYLFDAAGMIYLVLIAFFVALFAAESEARLFEVVRWVRISVLLVILVGTIGILLQVLTGYNDLFIYSRARKLIATFNFPNQLGGFLLLFFPLIWEEVQRNGPLVRKVFHAVVMVALICCIVATGSRSSVGALAVGIGFYGLAYLIRVNVKMIAAAGVVFAAGFVLVELFKDHIWVVRRALSVFSLETIQNGLTDPWRLDNWSLGIELFKQNPINGIGLANVQQINEHEIHNTFIAVLAEMGIVGAIAFIALMGYIFVIAIMNLKLSAKISSIYWGAVSRGLLIGFMTFGIYSIQHMMLRSRFFWLSIGLIIAVHLVLQLKFSVMKSEKATTPAGSEGSMA